MTAAERVAAGIAAARPATWSGTLRVEGDRPLTINRVGQMHRQTWATHTRETRGVWHLAALEHHIPQLAHCEIWAVPLHANHGSPQDVAACAPAAKAAIDGLVDAGVLADDNPSIVHRITFETPRVCGVNGLELQITGTLR